MGIFKKKEQWIYGTLATQRARKHIKKGNVQFVLWEKGEQGHKDECWNNYDSSWWPKFKPYKPQPNIKVKGPMKWVGKPISINQDSIFLEFRMFIIKRRAIRAWKASGSQYHIIPGGGDNVVIVNSNWRKLFNKHSSKSNRMNVAKLLSIALFSTPGGNRIIR